MDAIFVTHEKADSGIYIYECDTSLSSFIGGTVIGIHSGKLFIEAAKPGFFNADPVINYGKIKYGVTVLDVNDNGSP